MSPFIGELLGTMILIIFGGGVVAGVVLKKSKSEGSGWIVITIAWGLGVAMAIYAVGQISDAHINPAVTVGLAMAGDFPWASVPGYIAAQVIGAFIGGTLVWLHYYPHFKETEDQGAKLAVFATDPAIRFRPSNFFGEALGTFMLVFGILAIGANDFTEGLNPLIVGALIIVIGLSLGGTTGYAINPARDFGPRLVHFFMPIAGKGKSDWGYAWVPIVGPLLGGSLGALSYNSWFNGITTPAYFIVLAVFLAVQLTTIMMERKSTKQDRPGRNIVHEKATPKM